MNSIPHDFFHPFEIFDPDSTDLKAQPQPQPLAQGEPSAPRKRKEVGGAPRASPAHTTPSTAAAPLRLDIPESCRPGTVFDLSKSNPAPRRIMVNGHPEGAVILVPEHAFGGVHAQDVAETALLASHVVYVDGKGARSEPRLLHGLLHWADASELREALAIESKATPLEVQERAVGLDLSDRVEIDTEEAGTVTLDMDMLTGQWLADRKASHDSGKPMSFVPYASDKALRAHAGRAAHAFAEDLENDRHHPAFALFDDEGFGNAIAQAFRAVPPGQTRWVLVSMEGDLAGDGEPTKHPALACELRVAEDTLGGRTVRNHELLLYTGTATAAVRRLVETSPGGFAGRTLGHFIGDDTARIYLDDELGTLSWWPWNRDAPAEAQLHATDASVAASLGELGIARRGSWYGLPCIRALLRGEPQLADPLLGEAMGACLLHWPGQAGTLAGMILDCKGIDSATKAGLLVDELGDRHFRCPAENMLGLLDAVLRATDAQIDRKDKLAVLSCIVESVAKQAASGDDPHACNTMLHAVVRAVAASPALEQDERRELVARACEPWLNRIIVQVAPGAVNALRCAVEEGAADGEYIGLMAVVDATPPAKEAARGLSAGLRREAANWIDARDKAYIARAARSGVPQATRALNLHRTLRLPAGSADSADSADNVELEVHRKVHAIVSQTALGAADVASVLSHRGGTGRTAAQQAIHEGAVARYAAAVCAIQESAKPEEAQRLVEALGVTAQDQIAAWQAAGRGERARAQRWIDRAEKARLARAPIPTVGTATTTATGPAQALVQSEFVKLADDDETVAQECRDAELRAVGPAPGVTGEPPELMCSSVKWLPRLRKYAYGVPGAGGDGKTPQQRLYRYLIPIALLRANPRPEGV